MDHMRDLHASIQTKQQHRERYKASAEKQHVAKRTKTSTKRTPRNVQKHGERRKNHYFISWRKKKESLVYFNIQWLSGTA
jgi:hypothetical protein